MSKEGFTLVELMVAATVTTVALLGILGVFSGCFGVDQSARDLTTAINGARIIMEDLRTLRDQDNTRAPGHYTDTIASWVAENRLHSVAIDIIDDGTEPVAQPLSSATLYWVSISVSWMEQGGRIAGEDDGAGGGVAFDGILNGGEDANGNNIIDSPAQITTLLRP